MLPEMLVREAPLEGIMGATFKRGLEVGMARARKPQKLSDEERAALEKAAAQADAKFSRKFSATPTGKPTAEPKAGESVAEVVARPGDVAELKVLYPNGSQTLHAEMYTRRADRAGAPWRFNGLEDGRVRFTPLTVSGASNGWATDEPARLVRCQVINSDLATPWAIRIKIRGA